MAILRSLTTGSRSLSKRIVIIISTVLLLTLPVLYRALTRITPLPREPSGIFSRRLNEKERDAFMEIFRKLLHACTSNNITMFLHAGSMIGAYRHHGMIPWDQDIDVITNGSQRQVTWDAISSIRGLHLRNYTSSMWKLYASSSYTSPFIDIFFFTENSTHIYDENFSSAFWQRKELVFPLQMRPFETVFAPVPCNIVEYIKRAYSDPIDQCPHTFLRPGIPKGRLVPCTAFYEKFNFVFRTTMSDGVVLEELRHGHVKKQSFTLPDFC